MAEGQRDIGAITLMKTNEGYSQRERWSERKGQKKRMVVSVCVSVRVREER